MAILRVLLPLLFAGIVTAANGTCPTFVAQNTTATKYRVNFYDNGDSQFQAPPTLPANTTASSPWKLSQQEGAKFKIGNCTATTQSSCSHGGCYINYETTVQVIHAGTCLTTSSTTSNATYSFQPCLGPNEATQLFDTSQYVYYSPGYASITSIGQIDFFLIQATLDEGRAQAFYLQGDNRTIGAFEYAYTQAGLSAKLLEV